jgi:hypothetical protein
VTFTRWTDIEPGDRLCGRGNRVGSLVYETQMSVSYVASAAARARRAHDAPLWTEGTKHAIGQRRRENLFGTRG